MGGKEKVVGPLGEELFLRLPISLPMRNLHLYDLLNFLQFLLGQELFHHHTLLPVAVTLTKQRDSKNNKALKTMVFKSCYCDGKCTQRKTSNYVNKGAN